jgi:hypothetical protein
MNYTFTYIMALIPCSPYTSYLISPLTSSLLPAPSCSAMFLITYITIFRQTTVIFPISAADRQYL